MFSTSSRQRSLRLRALIPAAALALLAAPLALVAPATAFPGSASGVFLNELHYDNNGTDAGEFVEVANPAGADLTGWSVVLYNGNGGLSYDTDALSGTGTLQTVSYPGTFQNGAPDGVALADAGGNLVQFLSYEGPFAATNGPAAGQTSTDIGIAEVGTELAGMSLQLTGSGTTYGDFQWTGPADDSPGAVNTGQAFTGGGAEEPPPAVERATIAEIQGPGATSPLAGETVTTHGVVTAAYPTGNLFSFVIQTPGTGTGDDATPGASDALWVFQRADGVDAEIGQHVEVTGAVSERFGRTQLTYDPAAGPLEVLAEDAAQVTPLATDWWPTEEAREAHESELVDLSGQELTVTNNFQTNRFGEVGLATGSRPLVTPTEVANPDWDPAGHQAVVNDNFRRGVVLDDGADWDYQNQDFAKDVPLPWIDRTTTARVGAAARVTGPMIVDFGFGDWRLQPTGQVNGPAPELVEFEDSRPQNAEPRDVGGDLTIATFNVLNYFNTTGQDWVDSGRGTCTYFSDRDAEPVTDQSCIPNGPRGAADVADLQRQQDKIVAAINSLDASVVSLEEIENSAALGEADRDDALAELTGALNGAAGGQRWAYVPSPPPAQRPASEDVIRTAFIYDPSVVELVGDPDIHDDAAFANARQPLAQAFAPVGADDPTADAFAVIVNHFKSKGSACTGEPNGPQGNCNQTRIAQARSLADFADGFAAERGLEKVYLAGDFNAYTEEDPMLVLENRGYTQLESDTPDEWSYSFDGMSGSLDHVLANDAALTDVAGVDIWEINANESLAFEYSRFNYNVTDFYSPDVFRASDHNPELVGVDVRDATDVALSLSPAVVKQKKQTSRATVTVSGADHEATGTVRFLVDGVEVGRRALLDGTASVTVGPFAKGAHQVTVDYLGDDDNLPASDSARLVAG